MRILPASLALASASGYSTVDRDNAAATVKAREQSLEIAWSQELEGESKQTPIQRVVKLLKEMKSQLEEEANKESEMYDQMVCWCETNEKEKTKAIADADAADSDLTSEIESRSARTGELSTTVDALKTEIAEEEASLKEATAIREKEASEISAEQRANMQALTNVKNAIRVLGKTNGGSLLQSQSPVLASLKEVLRDAALKYDLMLGDSELAPVKPHTSAALLAVDSSAQDVSKKLMSLLDMNNDRSGLPVEFAQRALQEAASSASLLQGATSSGSSASYSPASGPIFGILKTMKEEFESNLSQAQKDEALALSGYKALVKAKSASIASSKAKLDSLEGEHAGNTKALSDAKEDLDITRKQRAADVKFLQNLKLTCQNLDREFEQRSKTRGEETKAVAEALSIITADDAQDLLRKTVSLLQVSSDTDSAAKVRRSRAAAHLRQAAHAPGLDMDDLFSEWTSRNQPVRSPRSDLSTLAVTVDLDGFAKVKEAMDNMIQELKGQQESEAAEKADCNKEFKDNEFITFTKDNEKTDLEASIETLSESIKKLGEDMEGAGKTQAATELEIQKASQNREKENSEYQTVVADQRATQAVLAKALAKLKEFYDKKNAFVQQNQQSLLQKVRQTPPVQFNKQKTNAGASPVMGLIEDIMQDAKALETEAVSAEAKAQADYETFVSDSNDLLAQLANSITTKTDALAVEEEAVANAKSGLETTNVELESLSGVKADLHARCDFLLKNFDLRQRARTQEIEAIQEGKAILSGSA